MGQFLAYSHAYIIDDITPAEPLCIKRERHWNDWDVYKERVRTNA